MPDIALQPDTEREFNDLCRDLARGWRLASHERSASHWLEPRLYRLVEHLDSLGLLQELGGQRLSALSLRGAPGRSSVTRTVLRLIFHGEANPPSVQQRSRMANRLDFALWHFVPPEFLKGFLEDAGQTPKHGQVLAGYEGWLVRQLQKSRNRDKIRQYPKYIAQLVKQPRARRWREQE